MKKFLIIAGVALFLASLAGPAAAKVTLGENVKGVQKIGADAPDVSMDTFQKGKVNIAELAKKNKVLVVTFIQTSCSACRGEIVELQMLAKKNDKIAVLPVDVDMRNAEEFLKSYTAENNISFDFGLDPDFMVPKVFGMSFTPGTVIIKDGKIAEVLRGYDDEIKKKLEDLFK